MYMQRILNITLAASFLVLLAACGGSAKDEKAGVGDLKVKLEKLKKENKSVKIVEEVQTSYLDNSDGFYYAIIEKNE